MTISTHRCRRWRSRGFGRTRTCRPTGTRRTRCCGSPSAWFGRSSVPGPAVLVVEDLHALDPASLNLVAELAAAPELPVLLLVTSRPTEAPLHAATLGRLGGAADAIRMALRPVEQTHVAAGLTARELDVLGCLAEGLSNQQIATRLTISVRTVAVHVSNVLRKTRSRSRTDAALWAVRHSLHA